MVKGCERLAEEKGKMLTCDRCGKEHFLKFVATNETDGGYTKYDIYEDKPDGWFSRDVGVTQVYDNVLLCPDCNEGFGRLMLDFMGEAHPLKKNKS